MASPQIRFSKLRWPNIKIHIKETKSLSHTHIKTNLLTDYALICVFKNLFKYR